MNTVIGEIINIEVNGSLSLLEIDVAGIILTSIVVETPFTASYLQKGRSIHLHFKETEVVLSMGEEPAVSMQNRIPGTITSILRGKLLAEITLTTVLGTIRSVIPSGAIDPLSLEVDCRVTALIKTNDILISE